MTRFLYCLAVSSFGLAALSSPAAADPARGLAESGAVAYSGAQLAASQRDRRRRRHPIRTHRPPVRACQFGKVMILNEANRLRKMRYYRVRYVSFRRDHSNCRQYLVFRGCRRSGYGQSPGRPYRIQIVFHGLYGRHMRPGRANHHCPNPPPGY